MGDPTAILIVGFASSRCSNCNRETMPDWETHDRVTGYGSRGPGCGARFTSISSSYRLTDEIRQRLAEMRPDLPVIDRSPFYSQVP